MQLRKNLEEGTKELFEICLVSVCAFCLVFIFFLVYFSMVFTCSSGSSGPKRHGTNDDEIRRIIAAEVASTAM